MCSSEENDGPISYSRTQVRSLIFHVLYALDASDYADTVSQVIDNINYGYDQNVPLDGEVAASVSTIIEHREKIDTIIQRFLENWRLSRLGICTRLILRIGVWELLFTDAPSSVVINEAIELAKDFAEKDAYKFINGILDQVAEKRDDLKKEYIK